MALTEAAYWGKARIGQRLSHCGWRSVRDKAASALRQANLDPAPLRPALCFLVHPAWHGGDRIARRNDRGGIFLCARTDHRDVRQRSLYLRNQPTASSKIGDVLRVVQRPHFDLTALLEPLSTV